MSTSLLYQAFGVRGYRYRRTDFVEGTVCFTLEKPRERYRCPECGSAAVHAQGHKDRFLQTIPIGLKPTFFLVKVPRVICFQCEHTRQVKVPFADPRRTYTHAFERYALELSKATTIQDAARHLDVSWDIIKDIQKRNLQRRFGKPKLKNLKEIAIDEVERNELDRLMAALRLNQELAIAYYLKEDLRQIWQQPDERTARRVLRDWLARARVSGIRMLQQFAATLEEHQAGILAYYDYPISTGPLEGLNNKIQTMKRQAYGFRDLEFFKLKILAIHQAKYALLG